MVAWLSGGYRSGFHSRMTDKNEGELSEKVAVGVRRR